MTPATRRAADFDRQNLAAAEWIASRPDLYDSQSGPAVWAALVLARRSGNREEVSRLEASATQRATGRSGDGLQTCIDFAEVNGDE